MTKKTIPALAMLLGSAFMLTAALHTVMPDARPSANNTLRSETRRDTNIAIPLFNRLSSPAKTPSVPVFTDGLPVIYGSLVYADWMDNYDPCGYYAFQPESRIKIQEIAVHPNLSINGGGAYSDRRLHYHLWEMYSDESSETGITFNNWWCVVNTDNWSFVNTSNFGEYQDNISYDMTYDPNSGNLYSIQWGPYESDYCDLARIDKTTGSDERIAKLPLMVCLACDNFGNLYSVGNDGNTYYINPADGSTVVLGPCGIIPKYVQSATVDPETNVIYWAADTESGAALYTIDTHSGRAVKVADMPGGEEFTALFVEAPRKGLDAPAALSDVRISYEGGKSIFTCTAPSKAFEGTSLSGNVDVKVWIDGNLAGQKNVAPGAQVRIESAVSAGEHSLVASATNAKGEGPQTVRAQYTGLDVPGPATNVTLSLSGLQANLSWEAPAAGMHGGQIVPSEVVYTVKRFPGGETVAENTSSLSFSETLPQGTATYYYTVTGFNSLGEGATAMSNSAFMGESFTVPYRQDFEDDASLDGFTILNSEAERGWFRWHNTAQNFKAMAHKFTKNDAADSWLILPSIEFDKNKEYKLRFNARVFSSEDPEKFEVTIGAGANASNQTRRLLSAQTIKNEKNKLYEIPFTVEASGTWNIAFHCVSPMMSYYLIIDDIEVLDASEAPIILREPMPVTNADCTVRTDGCTADISWTAPTLDVEGSPLKAENISYRILLNDGTVIADGINTTSYTDTRFASASSQRMAYYQIHAINGEHLSAPALTDMVLVGPDYPVPFEETFAGMSFDKNPWVLSTVKGDPVASWAIGSYAYGVNATPVGDDEGMVFFRASQLMSGYEGRITSAKMNLSNSEYADVSFWVYVPGGETRERLSLEITANDHVYIPLHEVDLTGEEGWRQISVRVPAQYCRRQTSIAFHGTARGGTRDICVDQISVTRKEGSGVDSLCDLGLEVSCENGILNVRNGSADDAAVFTPSGMPVCVCPAGENRRAVAPRGILIISCGGKSFKIAAD